VYVSFVVDAGSFPSGHILNLTAGLGFACFLAWTLMPRGWARQLVVLAVPIYLLALGFARIMSGQHWPSDVLGGYLIGALWLWVCLSLYRWIQRLRAS
jgi:undecaprenyl-diphosphatase